MYHSSRESFLYLEEFYVGEVVHGPEGDGLPASADPPSEEFMAQLRAYTRWRVAPEDLQRPETRVYKSF